MATHNVRVKLKAEIPVKNVDVEIPIRIDGELRGRLKISTGTIDWLPRSRRKAIKMSWSQFADLMEERR
jgi:hypothetical protein